MRNTLRYSAAALLLTLGGCEISNQPAAVPEANTAALNDEFTKDYLTTSKEVEKDFYLFESKTGGYTMIFPADAVISKEFNETRETFYETIVYGAARKDADIMADATFENKPQTQDIESNLDLLSTAVGYTGEYKEFKEKDKRIYYAKERSEIDGAISYTFFSFIKSEGDYQAVEFIYNATCEKSDESCPSAAKDQEKIALKIMNSVTFK
ncbi:hypothetical protein [Bacillus sp. SJS]|uniref:hypothetical protein n=1 Tax=Bacillus sp. SJS TaxID=1423321 RepID=UPI00068BA28E|nr:hypothetical protein [Bacillus sp. SJS]KZZ84984.1 hypothetical protein AS29_007995 [Bacillus sp. SJS]